MRMKYATTSVGAVLAILAVALVAGVTTASADTLCMAKEKACAAKNDYANETLTKFHKVVTFVGGGGTTTCDALYEGVLGPDIGPLFPRSLTIYVATYSNCTGACTGAVAKKLNWSASFIDLGDGFGTLTIFNSKVLLTGCPFGLQCEYEAKEAALSFTGGKGFEAKEPATITGSGIEFTRSAESSKLCAASGSMKTELEVTAPTGGFWLEDE
jgi:hypothetical protein